MVSYIDKIAEKITKISFLVLILFGATSVLASPEKGLSIHLNPTIVGHFMGIPITNTLITVWFVMLFLVVLSLYIRTNIQMVPSKIQLIFEEMIGYVYNYVAETLESPKLAKKVFPLIMTIFIFILVANWIGLVPGIASIGFYEIKNGIEEFVPILYPANTDLNVTIALAIIVFFSIEIIGISMLGVIKYGRKFINFSSPLAFVIGIIELISEIARLISFSFRLFGNIFAGKTLMLVAIAFVPYILPVPVLAFEVFVGFIQAFIFAILTLFFIKIAIAEPQH